MGPEAAVSRFVLPGLVQRIAPLGGGLIHETWLVVTEQVRGVLQRINTAVFPHPSWIMVNLQRIHAHLDRLPYRRVRLPALIPARDARLWVEGKGEYWRMLEFIDGVTLREVASPAIAESLGWSLGHLHRLLAGLDPAGLYDTLPGFHRISRYLQEFDCACAGWRGRLDAELGEAFAFIRRHRDRALLLEAAPLPVRVVHGDPKLDNILFDRDGLRPVAWVDLDTIKPGGVLQDIGDCVRSACGQGGRFDLDKAEILLKGWFGEARAFLDAEEIRHLPEALWLLPFELGVRFLGDHLAGNRYFRVRDRRENLRRALEQFALARDVARQEAGLFRLWRSLSAAPGK